MINVSLFLLLLLYTVSIYLGFLIGADKRRRKQFRTLPTHPFLYKLGFLPFILSLYVIWFGFQKQEFLGILLFFDILFLLYYIKAGSLASTCWRQHRMIFFNFFLVILIYYVGLLIDNPSFHLFALGPYLYSLFEFQKAKFDPKQGIIWD